MKTCAPATALFLFFCACSSPSGGGGTSHEAIATPPPAAPSIDGKLLGVWKFDGQIRGGDAYVCGSTVACTNETLQFLDSGALVMRSAETGVLNCTYSADGAALTYKCNGAAVTRDYTFNNAGDLLCVWQNTSLAYCYAHQ